MHKRHVKKNGWYLCYGGKQTIPLVTALILHHHSPFFYPFFFISCRFVSQQNSCARVCVFSWAVSETTIKITSASMMVWVKNVLRMIPFWISKERFLCACMRVCVRARECCCCCCIGGFSSIEKCILLSWPSNLVILWIKVIKVSIERILKCVEFLHSMNGWQFT